MNKKSPILSIIIPSYNIEKYIDQCVPTYIDERFFGLLNVIFVDDGSKDNTYAKLSPFLQKYPDLFSYYYKDNGGHGSVINFALRFIKTKYFKVIDGDDWVQQNELYKLLLFLTDSDDDLIINDYSEVFEDHVEPHVCNTGSDNSLSNYILTIHSMTFKTDIFIQNSIKISEKVFYDDNEYVLYPLQFIKTISYSHSNVYMYRRGHSTQSVSLSSRIKHLLDLETVLDNIFVHYKENKAILPTHVKTQYYAHLSSIIIELWFVYMLAFKSNVARRKIKDQYNIYKQEKFLLRFLAKRKSFRILRLTRFCFISFYKTFLLKKVLS